MISCLKMEACTYRISAISLCRAQDIFEGVVAVEQVVCKLGSSLKCLEETFGISRRLTQDQRCRPAEASRRGETSDRIEVLTTKGLNSTLSLERVTTS